MCFFFLFKIAITKLTGENKMVFMACVKVKGMTIQNKEWERGIGSILFKVWMLHVMWYVI